MSNGNQAIIRIAPNGKQMHIDDSAVHCIALKFTVTNTERRTKIYSYHSGKH
jgi:hypothetical protein